MRIMVIPLLVFSLVASTNLYAQGFSWNGVLTQGVFHTDHYNLYGDSENSASFDFTEASINGSYFFPRGISLVGQAIYRHAGASFDGVNIDYLNVDFQPWVTDDYTGGIALGRVKRPFGLYNATRDIAFTRPSIYLSQSTYIDSGLRDMALSVDGVIFYGEYITNGGAWSFELMYGDRSQPDSGAEFSGYIPRTPDARQSSVEVGESKMIAFSFTSYAWPVELGLGYEVIPVEQTEIGNLSSLIPNFPSAIGAFEGANDIEIKRPIISISVSKNDWTAVLEYSRPKTHVDLSFISFNPAALSVLSFFPDTIDNTSESYYLQLDRYINST